MILRFFVAVLCYFFKAPHPPEDGEELTPWSCGEMWVLLLGLAKRKVAFCSSIPLRALLFVASEGGGTRARRHT